MSVSIGGTKIRVLEFLNGRKLDEVAHAYISACRPSRVRVSTGEITLDSRPWRVTVYVDGENTIKYIEQEVQVTLPAGVRHGHDLDRRLKGLGPAPDGPWIAVGITSLNGEEE